MVKLKEPKKSKKPSKSWEYYKNDKLVKKVCPKCGLGFNLAEHKKPNRLVCGKCYYVENITNNSQ
jgi:ribosomal protein S27AE